MVDNELLAAFVGELEALRTHGESFARDFPDVASRLDIGGRRSSDAQVERLVECTAFLAARLRMVMEQSATEVPLAMLSLLAPSLVEPVPSMALMQLTGGSEAQELPRNSRFDGTVGGGSLICFSTTMPVTIAPVRLLVRRLEPSAGSADGLAVQVLGTPPPRMVLCLGKSERTAATLMDSFSEHLVGIDLWSAAGETTTLSTRQLRIHGFSADEAALPIRPASHPAHRVVMEFMNFPDKFRFVSLNGVALRSGDEIRFRFDRPMQLSGAVDNDLVTVNRVPVINLWQATATPVDVDGRRLEYPVRVDALRYRTVECHSVESVDLYRSGAAGSQRLDPVVGFGAVNGTSLQWGVRRTMSRTGGEVFLHFRGLDYGNNLGKQQMLAMANVMASNRHIAQSVRVGVPMAPVDGAGNWRGTLVAVPTAYIPGVVGAGAMETMIGYLNSSAVGLVGDARRGGLRRYLKRFPGADRASWIDGIGSTSTKGIMVTRGRQQQSGVALMIDYDAERYANTSEGMVKRVLGQLFDSQRGINRIEDIVINGAP